MKIRKFLAFSAFAFIGAVLFGCSGDDNGDGLTPSLKPGEGGDKVEGFSITFEDSTAGTFSGDGNIKMYTRGDNALIDFGTVTAGKGKLNFPTTVASERLMLATDAPPEISISPKTLEFFGIYSRIIMISGNNAYYLTQGNESVKIIYVYFSEAATVKGTYSDCDGRYCSYEEYDISVNSGWNTIYISGTETATEDRYKYTTNPDAVNLNGIKWTADYVGPASYFGGGGDQPTTGFCNIPSYGACVSMETLGGNAQNCTAAGGTVVTSCPTTEPEPTTGFCDIPSYGACVPMETLGGSAQTCSLAGGTVVASCPTTEPEPTTGFCVDHYSEECVSMANLQNLGYTCRESDGENMETCPSGYYTIAPGTTTGYCNMPLYEECIPMEYMFGSTAYCTKEGGTVVTSCPTTEPEITTGFCDIAGLACVPMETLGGSAQACSQYGGTVVTSCPTTEPEITTGFCNITGMGCVSMEMLGGSAQTCLLAGGTVVTSCPTTGPEPTAGYCVDHYYKECVSMADLQDIGYTCREIGGETSATCPSGYEKW